MGSLHDRGGPQAKPRDAQRKESEKFMESSHANALQQKHEDLERQIQEEMNHPMPDETLLHQLKKQKLRIKEELARL